MDLAELQDIDVSDLSSWPIWFKWVVIVLLGVGIVFFGYKNFVKPEIQALEKLEKEEVNLKKVFMEKKEQVINLPAYEQQMIEITERFGVVLRQLPDRTEVPALLIDISQVGLARGLKFELFKPETAQTKEFYNMLPISIKVIGSYHQLAEFVSDLAGLPRIVTVGDFNIGKPKDGKGNQLLMSAKLFTYQYLDEDQGVATQKKVRAQG